MPKRAFHLTLEVDGHIERCGISKCDLGGDSSPWVWK